ncbi:MAG: pyridoxamine 5'-phosphate oxidase family protein [Myxococcaceae bacterium]
MKSSTDVAFSPAVKRVQAEHGSRSAYARLENRGGFATEIDDDLRAFLARIDTAFLATASADGQPYVQHRGGPKGFIHALDDHTLAFTELDGNKQYISAGNLSENDRVCLLLMDFEHRQRVKVWGRARLEGDQMLITVSAWDANCPRHITPRVTSAW